MILIDGLKRETAVFRRGENKREEAGRGQVDGKDAAERKARTGGQGEVQPWRGSEQVQGGVCGRRANAVEQQ
jgi:hypothetical protein